MLYQNYIYLGVFISDAKVEHGMGRCFGVVTFVISALYHIIEVKRDLIQYPKHFTLQYIITHINGKFCVVELICILKQLRSLNLCTRLQWMFYKSLVTSVIFFLL